MDKYRRCCAVPRGTPHATGCTSGPGAYDYIRRHYNLTFNVDDRVRHTVTGQRGQVRPSTGSADHYVQVRFHGQQHAMPCHPEELEQLVPEEECPGHVGAADDPKFCAKCGVHVSEME